MYGSSICVNYILCDDCSSDMTVDKARVWLNTNKCLFNDIAVISNNENIGIVKNYINGLKKVKTKKFKVLAADDLYFINDIFSIDNSSLVLTPVIGFNNRETFASNMYIFRKFAKYKFSNVYNILKRSLLYTNEISAPGAFVSSDIICNDVFFAYISDYKWIEDYPQWLYIFYEYKNIIDVSIDLKPYVLYRTSDGITRKNSIFHNEYIKENKLLEEKYSLKRAFLYKYFNPYSYNRRLDMFLCHYFASSSTKKLFEVFDNEQSGLYETAKKHIAFLEEKTKIFNDNINS